MLNIAIAIFGLFAGASIGYHLAIPEDCPRRVLNYNCRGDICDHSKSLLYANMSAMAKNDEDKLCA